jgi:hypothetical protein
MQYVEAIARVPLRYPSVFLAGGITGCPPWQSEAVAVLAHLDVTVLNPRRADFPMGDPQAGREQILWEFEALRMADMVAFWFPEETLCPITLFEYGKHLVGAKPLIVGIHPRYARRVDLLEQTALERNQLIAVDFDLFLKDLQLGATNLVGRTHKPWLKRETW